MSEHIDFINKLAKAEGTLVQLENTDSWYHVHHPDACMGEFCTVHNRSDHHMRSWPQHWREDTRIMERICTHGVGHPDPDEINQPYGHGCDGCCSNG